MASLGSWAVDEVSLDVDYPSAAIAALNAGLRSLATSKDTNGATHLHAVLESVVAILTLVGVSPLQFPLLYLLIVYRTGTRW